MNHEGDLNMATDFIIDMETLGQADRAVVLSIGVFPIPEEDPKEVFGYSMVETCSMGYYAKIERESQIKLGRTIEQDTLNWWKAQGDSARNVLSSTGCWEFEKVHKDIMAILRNYDYNPKNSRIWSRGMIDQRWFQSLCRTYHLEEIPFWIWRDIRTALEILTGSPFGTLKEEDDLGFIKHNALHDCVLDYYRLKEAFENAK